MSKELSKNNTRLNKWITFLLHEPTHHGLVERKMARVYHKHKHGKCIIGTFSLPQLHNTQYRSSLALCQHYLSLIPCTAVCNTCEYSSVWFISLG